MFDLNRVEFIEVIYKDKTTEIIKTIDCKIVFTDYIRILTNRKIKKIKFYKCYEVIK